MTRDLYEVLGVAVDASPEDIRRAYKARCLTCHPDKNRNAPEAAAAFKELSQAYTTLSTAQTRAEYNHQRRARSYRPSRTPFANADINSNAADPFADPEFRRLFTEAVAKSCAAEGHPMEPSQLFDSLFGKARAEFGSVPLSPGPKCDTDDNVDDVDDADDDDDDDDDDVDVVVVDDDGDENKNTPSHAHKKHASRSRESHRKLPKAPDHEVELPLTLEELYRGCVKKRRLRKQVFDSATSRFVERAEILNITVRPGYKPGDKIRFHEASDHGVGVTPADVVFIITQVPHHRFSLHGQDLGVTIRMGIADALAGSLISLDLLSGESIQIRTTEIVSPGQVKRIKGKGMPRPPGSSSPFGDLIVSFNVQFPQSLTGDEKLKVRDLFDAIEDRMTGSAPQVHMRRTSSMFGGSSSKRTRSSHGTGPSSRTPSNGQGSMRLSGSRSFSPSDGDHQRDSARCPSSKPLSRPIDEKDDDMSSVSSARIVSAKSKAKKRMGFFFF